MEIIKQYQLQEIVGRGGMSMVYRAYDAGMERQVAVKLMHESLSGDEKAIARFSQEVQFVKALGHPAIVPVLDYGEVDGRFYIVRPYLSGGSLRERIEAEVVVASGATISDGNNGSNPPGQYPPPGGNGRGGNNNSPNNGPNPNNGGQNDRR